MWLCLLIRPPLQRGFGWTGDTGKAVIFSAWPVAVVIGPLFTPAETRAIIGRWVARTPPLRARSSFPIFEMSHSVSKGLR